jgi:class 3 adenylate cyclase/tetratricopeptide (TPR) repeat protein
LAENSAEDVKDGERKTVTALFADIRGSTELMEDLDPEEAHAVVDPVLRIMVEAVHRYEGYVVRTTGDGIFALFGAPVAHEDHPQRALSAALRLQQELHAHGQRRIEQGLHPLEARVGVHSGEVVAHSVETDGKMEYRLVGHAANLAARMEMVAPTGSIAASEYTRKLCDGYFTFKPLGPMTVKGISEPVAVYEVTGFGPLRTRLQRAAARGLTKFVGREREIDALRHAAGLARDGHGQLVAVMAEPGVGKSRLFYEFKIRSQSGWMVLEAFSISHGKASAYLPVLDLLHSYFKITSDDDTRTRREKVTGRVLALERILEDTLPYLFTLLGIVEGEDALAQMDANLRKRRTLDAIKRILLRESLNQPLIVMFEDLHWIDEQTQEFLNLLADSLANAKFLLLVNYRPEYSHQWGSKTYYMQLRLDPLGIESADEMLSALLGDSPDMAPVRKLFIERTEGNPFFMEEMYQAMLEGGVIVRNGAVKLMKPPQSMRIPATVQGILAARIDRLPAAARQLLQTLSVIGREFPLSLIRAVHTRSEDELNRMLNDLQLSEFIYEQPGVGDTEFVFKHALTQEVAYNSVLQEGRKLMHERTGAAMETLYVEHIADHIAQLAHHYARGAKPAKAVEYSLRACQQSSDRASYAEAVGHFETGLARLQELPDDGQRAELELDLRNAAQFALRITKGLGSAESEESNLRALEISRRPGVHWEKAWKALLGLCATALSRANLEKARELATQLLAIAEQSGNVDVTAESVYFLAFSQMFAGDIELAAKSFDRSVSLFETTPSRTSRLWRHTYYYAHAYAVSACNSWFLGFPDRAMQLLDNSFAVARVSDSKAIEKEVRLLSSLVFSHRREVEQTRQSATVTIALATELGDPFRHAVGGVLLGWSESVTQDRYKGLARMQRALADLNRTGSLIGRSLWLSMTAQVQCLLGQYDNASVAIGDALAAIEQTGERVYEAEIHRIHGELLLAKDAPNAMRAEQSFRTAIEIAHRQKASGWELRATTSLARLLRDTDRRDEARTMLAEIYNWFTEGFDTADLKDAKALLDELNN